jgi:hypothetical protein
VNQARDASHGSYYWPAIACLLFGLTAYNMLERHRVFAAVTAMQDKQAVLHQALTGGRAALAELSGRRVVWPQALRQETTVIHLSRPETTTGRLIARNDLLPRGYRVVAVLDSLTCQTPQNAVTRLLIDAQRALATPGVRLSAVVRAEELRTVRSYALSNSLTFPLWFDAHGDFVKENALPEAPLVLVLDDDDRIVDALSPFFETTEMWLGTRISVLNLLTASGPVSDDKR